MLRRSGWVKLDPDRGWKEDLSGLRAGVRPLPDLNLIGIMDFFRYVIAVMYKNAGLVQL